MASSTTPLHCAWQQEHSRLLGQHLRKTHAWACWCTAMARRWENHHVHRTFKACHAAVRRLGRCSQQTCNKLHIREACVPLALLLPALRIPPLPCLAGTRYVTCWPAQLPPSVDGNGQEVSSLQAGMRQKHRRNTGHCVSAYHRRVHSRLCGESSSCCNVKASRHQLAEHVG